VENIASAFVASRFERNCPGEGLVKKMITETTMQKIMLFMVPIDSDLIASPPVPLSFRRGGAGDEVIGLIPV